MEYTCIIKLRCYMFEGPCVACAVSDCRNIQACADYLKKSTVLNLLLFVLCL